MLQYKRLFASFPSACKRKVAHSTTGVPSSAIEPFFKFELLFL